MRISDWISDVCSSDLVMIDLASDRLFDMSYTSGADIYLGDVSSQVYGFLATPRPCLFLDTHGVDWEGDPDYLFWMPGDVASDRSEERRVGKESERKCRCGREEQSEKKKTQLVH